MTELRAGLPPLPERLKSLPIDERGYPVPRFVEWIDGKPDFRVMSSKWLVECVKQLKCWVCGDPLGKFLAFTIGPMCAVTRTNSEPPSHRECAIFSAQACPFLTRPQARRRVVTFGHVQAAGIPIDRNPGVATVWVTKDYNTFPDQNRRVLFRIGEPTEVLWFCEGRPATRQEVEESIRTGIPLLAKEAEKEGPLALTALMGAVKAVAQYLPEKRLVTL